MLVGLLGTIIGLITSFSGVSEADAATKAALLSQGISEALNCTAFGLLVAIIAIFGLRYFSNLNWKSNYRDDGKHYEPDECSCFQQGKD